MEGPSVARRLGEMEGAGIVSLKACCSSMSLGGLHPYLHSGHLDTKSFKRLWIKVVCEACSYYSHSSELGTP